MCYPKTMAQASGTPRPTQEDFAARYHAILCADVPAFLGRYASLPLMRRLGGVGLLCGTDWTPLFNNRFFYSRLDHSIGTALITWRFTHDKVQTIAALLHDVATPAFSHVVDFKNHDAMTQSSTERLAPSLIARDDALLALLVRDGIAPAAVSYPERYPVVDNAIPRLSADRLEYMYPTAAALSSLWSIDEIERNFAAVKVLTSEEGAVELGFGDVDEASRYTVRFAHVGLMLQQGEDKLAMQLLADVLEEAERVGLLTEGDLYAESEERLIAHFTLFAHEHPTCRFASLFRTFRGTRCIVRGDTPPEGYYCVSVKTKLRYVDPLVETPQGIKRTSAVSPAAQHAIEELLRFEDSPFACARWL